MKKLIFLLLISSMPSLLHAAEPASPSQLSTSESVLKSPNSADELKSTLETIFASPSSPRSTHTPEQQRIIQDTIHYASIPEFDTDPKIKTEDQLEAIKTLNRLLAKGHTTAIPNWPDVGLPGAVKETPLYYAIMNANPVKVQLVLNAGANPFKLRKDWGGSTRGVVFSNKNKLETREEIYQILSRRQHEILATRGKATPDNESQPDKENINPNIRPAAAAPAQSKSSAAPKAGLSVR